MCNRDCFNCTFEDCILDDKKIDPHNENSKRYYREHKEKCLAYGKRYREQHKEKLNAYSKAYYHANKEKFREYKRKKRLEKKLQGA